MKKAILVVAPPRSGTSVVSHVLSKLGVDFGDPEHFVDIEIHAWNPIFFELLSLNRLNDDIFDFYSKKFVDFDWIPEKTDFNKNAVEKFAEKISQFIEAEFSSQKLIGLKDTRFCYTVPLWDIVLKRLGFEVSYVLVRRSSDSVFLSNKTLNQYPSEVNFRLVAQSFLSARHFVEGKKFISIRYENLLKRKKSSVRHICDGLDLDHALIDEACSVIQGDLNHYKAASRTAPYNFFSNVTDSAAISPNAYLQYREIFLAANFENKQRIATLGAVVSEREQKIEQLGGELTRRNEALAASGNEIERISAAQNAVRATLAERDKKISRFDRTVSERDSQIENLLQTVSGRDKRINTLNRTVTEREHNIGQLGEALTRRDEALGARESEIERISSEVNAARAALAERDGEIENLNRTVSNRDSRINKLHRTMTERDGQVDGLLHTVVERERKIARLDETLSRRNEALAARDNEIERVSIELNADRAMLAERDERIGNLDRELAAMRNSTSWRMSSPLRWVGSLVKRPK